MKYGSASDKALGPHPSTHQLGEPLAYDQSQAGSAITAGHGCIGLTEGMKEAMHLVLGDADACIFHGKMDLIVSVLLEAARDRYCYCSLLREFYGVIEQVYQYLIYPGRISQHCCGDARANIIAQGQFLSAGIHSHHIHGGLQAVGQEEGLLLQLYPICLDLGEVQDVVDG